MVRARALAAVVTLAASFGISAPLPAHAQNGAPASSLLQVARLTAARGELQAHLVDVQRNTGPDGASGLQGRLSDDIDTARDQTDRPPGYSAQQWSTRVAAIADLDTKLVGEMIAGTVTPPAAASGMDELLMRSTLDGTLQPYAIYVPKNLGGKTALIVLLHGNPQTEVELLSGSYFHDLADATGAVIVAPWGRGIYDYASPGSDDVYQLADEARSAFHISQQRVYLVGYSMGGFSVFKIGPLHAERWEAIMCISGAILNSETALVRYRFRETPIYVVTGSNDTNIPTVYGEETAAFLASAGMQVSFYEQKDGTHYLPTLLPSLTAAWNDMLAGRVLVSSTPTIVGQPPSAAPSSATVKY
jgi:pimeloyl-ACP methyl ester carboxylesterase